MRRHDGAPTVTSDPLPIGATAPAERRAPAPHWPLLAGCALLVLLGVVLRVEQLDSPKTFGFDEHHFVENARNYLRGRADVNDHPPLGKLTIALSMMAFGDRSFAWRVPALIAGLATIALGAALARRLFPSRLAPWVAAAFLAGDGFFIGYSRAGLLDAQLVALAVGATLLVASRPGARALVAAGLLAGLAMNVKLSGVVLTVPLAIGLAQARLDRRARLAAAAGTALAMAIGFWVPWAIGLAITGKPADPWHAVQETQRLLAHHAALTKMDNDLTSSWPTWLFAYRPIVLVLTGDGESVRMVTSLGNPLVWIGSSLAMVGTFAALLWNGARATLSEGAEPPSGSDYWATQGRGSLVLLVGWLSFLAPWMLSRRDPYIYHYLPCYFFAVVALASMVAWVAERRRALGLLGVVLALVVAGFYAPVWGQLPVTHAGLHARLPFARWR